jgi:hypothetical protein
MKMPTGLGMMIHTYSPSYWGGGGRRIMVSPEKVRVRLSLKNKLKAKGLGAWLKWSSTHLTSTKPWPPVSPKIRKGKAHRKKCSLFFCGWCGVSWSTLSTEFDEEHEQMVVVRTEWQWPVEMTENNWASLSWREEQQGQQTWASCLWRADWWERRWTLLAVRTE